MCVLIPVPLTAANTLVCSACAASNIVPSLLFCSGKQHMVEHTCFRWKYIDASHMRLWTSAEFCGRQLGASVQAAHSSHHDVPENLHRNSAVVGGGGAVRFQPAPGRPAHSHAGNAAEAPRHCLALHELTVHFDASYFSTNNCLPFFKILISD